MKDLGREIPGSNGKYFISLETPEGKCYSLWCRHGWRKKPYELSAKPDKKGYIYWGLIINDKQVTGQVARWVALTYPELVENEYFDGAEIDHKDTNTLNNHPSNLRWVSRTGNQNNPLTRTHISNSRKGKHPTEETRKKMSESRKGRTLTEETKQKISKAHKGKHLTEEHKKQISQKLTGRKGHPGTVKQKEAVVNWNKTHKLKPICQYDKNGTLLREYSSLKEAAEYTGLNYSAISRAALGKAKTSGGYVWKY